MTFLPSRVPLIQAPSAPFNVNFFCHAEPAPDPEIEARWRNRLALYYAEAGVDPSAIPAGPVRAPFDARLCAVIEETRPPVVSFHFGFSPPPRGFCGPTGRAARASSP